MKYLLASLFSTALLGGCAAVPYDTGTGYYGAYPATVTAQAPGGYYYPDQSYPYAASPYARPYSPYPYYQPPAYSPPAPIIVPPAIEFRYERNVRPGWQGQPHPHDQFRNGPPPQGNRSVTPRPQWGYRNDAHPDWQRKEWQHRDSERRNDQPNNRLNDRPNFGQHDGPRGDFQRR